MKIPHLLFRLCSLGAILLSLQTSCRKAASDIPFFLKCDSATIVPSSRGIANSGIYGLYLTVENDVRGTWQLPFTMPILKEGMKTMVVNPVIKYNNLSTKFLSYPLLNTQIVPINMVKGSTLDTTLSFEYGSDVIMLANEDMEININFSAATRDNMARNGTGSMKLTANTASPDSSAVAFYSKQVPFKFEKTTFLEFDYYMPEGILAPTLAYQDANNNTRQMFGESYLNANTGWTHVYYNLTYIIDRIGASGSYTPVFILTMPNGKSSAVAYIDNVRILEK